MNDESTYVTTDDEQDELAGDTFQPRRGPAPILLRLLAALHLIGGVGLLYLFVQVLLGDRVPAPLPGFSAWQLLAIPVVLGGLGLVSGVGMFAGQSWGWWAAGVYYMNSSLRSFYQIYAREVLYPDQEFSQPSIRFVGRIIVSALCLYYIFRPSVLSYFGMTQVHPTKSLGKMFSAACAIGGVFALIFALG